MTDIDEPIKPDELCANCGWPHEKHRATTDQCPVSEHHIEWRETKFERQEACPKCGSTNTEKRHADTPNNAGTETDWRQCEDCGHQWGHQ